MKSFALVAMLAACGGSTSKPAMPIGKTDPMPMTEPPPATDATTMPAPALPDPGEPAKPDPAARKAELLAAETAAYERAKPVFEAHCARCHSRTGKMSTAKKRGHFDMTTYPFGGHHAMEIAKEIRTALGMTGGKPTMPYDRKGSVKGDDLALIAAWADAFDAAHAGGAHEGHGDDDHGDHDDHDDHDDHEHEP